MNKGYGAIGNTVVGNEYQALLGSNGSADLKNHRGNDAVDIVKPAGRPHSRTYNIVIAVIAAVCTGTIIHVLTAVSTGKSIVSDEISFGASSASSYKYSGVVYGDSHEPAMATAAKIPFPAVDRSEYSDVEVTTIVDPNLFHPSLRYPSSGKKLTRSLSESVKSIVGRPLLKVPFPTGAFWTNLVMEPTPELGLSFPVMAYPYGFKWSPSLLQISYPPLRRLTNSIAVRDIFNPDLTLSVKETIATRHITHFDPLSVTLRFDANNGTTSPESEGSSFFETYLVQGSPYVTNKFKGVTPILTALSTFQGIRCPPDTASSSATSRDQRNTQTLRKLSTSTARQMASNNSELCHSEDSESESVAVSGTRFLLQTTENLTWMIFASEPITLKFDTTSRRTVTSARSFTGVLRMALLPPQNMNDEKKDGFVFHFDSFPVATSSGVKHLIEFSNVYPVSSEVSWKATGSTLSSNSKRELGKLSKTVATVSFAFETETMNGETQSNSDLLMLALPHHTKLLDSSVMLKDFDVTYECIKGRMSPVLGGKWSYDEVLTNVEFDEPASQKAIAKWSSATKEFILNQAKDDLTKLLPTLDENVYGFGKQVARLAQLAHIVSTISSDESSELTNLATSLLYNYLATFLEDENKDNLLYDVNFGGIISRDGLEDAEADFGNGWYNDHHFHYGYILYASAIMGKLNSTFVSTYGTNVDAILYDISYITNGDSVATTDVFFPFARYKSWYDGHSFASGLFPFVTGKSQESSSEAINSYYGAYLWSLVRWGEDDKLGYVDFTRLLLATEIRGAKAYWQMGTANDPSYVATYDSEFERNYMVGNVGMLDVTLSTWFGTEQLYVHMINFMPVTAITREIFDRSYAEQEFDEAISPIYDSVPMPWKGYTVCDRGLFEPAEAWKDAAKLKNAELDSGLSKSQVYYWIGTSKGFVPPEPTAVQATANTKGSDQCVNNSACAALGLVGNCCPTEEGILLGCCDAVLETTCEANKGCADAGLTGYCCPSAEGVYLGCCSDN